MPEMCWKRRFFAQRPMRVQLRIVEQKLIYPSLNYRFKNVQFSISGVSLSRSQSTDSTKRKQLSPQHWLLSKRSQKASFVMKCKQEYKSKGSSRVQRQNYIQLVTLSLFKKIFLIKMRVSTSRFQLSSSSGSSLGSLSYLLSFQSYDFSYS